MTRHDRGSGFIEWLSFSIKVLRADLGNFLLFQHRTVDAFLITGKNSGTHWVKYMLSCAIAHHYGVPPPAHASGRAADAIIGHPRWPPLHAGLPRLASSHTIPSIAFAWKVRWFARKPVVVLVRDIRTALLSNYVKWQASYGVSFSQYLAGDPSGRRFVADIWWYIHFFNRWGDIARAWPQATLVVRYEDVQAAPSYWLRRIAKHMGVQLSDVSLAAALPFVDRAAMQAQLDPDFEEVIIPGRSDRDQVVFSAADTALVDAILHRYLRHGLGYDVRPPARPPQPHAGVGTDVEMAR